VLKLELVGARPLHLAGARPLGRLKAPLGLSLLRKRGLVGARPLHLAGARPLGRLKAPLGLSLLRKRGFYCSIGFIVGILSEICLQRFVMLHNRIFTCVPGIHNPS